MSSRLGAGEAGPLATGIALASAVMYIRVLTLAAILAPFVALDLVAILGPAALVAWLAAAVLWRADRNTSGAAGRKDQAKPFKFLPALGFATAVAAAALLVRWAQSSYGEVGGAWSLFLAGSFDVDAAIVTLSTLPRESLAPEIAAVALGGTVMANMAFKTGVLLANARLRAGSRAAAALLASQTVLAITVVWRLAETGPNW